MTTPQPAALPEKLIFSERLAISEAAQVPMDAECCRVIQATLDYIRSNYALAALRPQAESDEEQIADYQEALASVDALVRRLDVAINDNNAAPQARLCDIVSQVEREGLRPQAVPMSHHDVVVMQFKLGQKFNDMTIGDLQTVVTAVEAHHGITAQGAQGEQA